jgi:hypothetical protein
MREPNDWRLTNQHRHLMHARLVYREYEPAPGNDHDHCEFCWAKFMHSGDPDILTEGYSTPDRYRWICEQCFNDFAPEFQWEVERAA